MLNSPTLCQLDLCKSLEFIRKQFLHVYIIHYMDAILLVSPSNEELQHIFLDTEIMLKEYGLYIAVDKLQEQEPYTYSGYILQRNIKPQKIQIRTDSLKTLNDFMKLLGDINWLRPSLGIPNHSLTHLFQILRDG